MEDKLQADNIYTIEQIKQFASVWESFDLKSKTMIKNYFEEDKSESYYHGLIAGCEIALQSMEKVGINDEVLQNTIKAFLAYSSSLLITKKTTIEQRVDSKSKLYLLVAENKFDEVYNELVAVSSNNHLLINIKGQYENYKN